MASDPINAALPPELYDWKDGLPNLFNYAPRKSHEVRIGNCPLGGDHPLRIQSMTTTPTADAAASAAQCRTIIEAGADYVRLTAQGTREAEALREIKEALRREGFDTPLVADIHFNPNVADVAAEIVEKVRINPGNYVDPARKFKHIEYTDEAYAEELRRLEERFVKLLGICRAHGTALRIGVNHGSLSDRIMSRYGDTPAGMVESAMEFLRVSVRHNFPDIVVSIKASNVGIMVQTMRMMAEAMERENMTFPLHLGVTEAGDGEDGRVKSAVGIGTLLAQGIGDTIRVSLSEAPEAEVPVAQMLVKHIGAMTRNLRGIPAAKPGGVPVVVGADITEGECLQNFNTLTLSGPNAAADAELQLQTPSDKPVALHAVYPAELTKEEVTLAAAVDLGSLLLAGYGDAVWLTAPQLSDEERNSLLFTILQSTRRRITRTEFIACPSCGRTLFDLQGTLARVKAATSHLPGLKIAVMGCVVNGPGEMADADYGYVGAAVNRISLYRGKQCVAMNLPEEEAIEHLVSLLKEDGKWVEPSLEND